jgi:hypothetical protein
MSSDQFEDLTKRLATTSTRRGALGVLAGGIATLWGLGRITAGQAAGRTACLSDAECPSTSCCCHNHVGTKGSLKPKGVCITTDHCLAKGNVCL